MYARAVAHDALPSPSSPGPCSCTKQQAQQLATQLPSAQYWAINAAVHMPAPRRAAVHADHAMPAPRSPTHCCPVRYSAHRQHRRCSSSNAPDHTQQLPQLAR